MSGDEAPIRVKGGSITFELLSKEAKWEPQGNKDHWIITCTPDRHRDEYLVLLIIKDAEGRLESQTLRSRKKIQIFYHNREIKKAWPLMNVVYTLTFIYLGTTFGMAAIGYGL